MKGNATGGASSPPQVLTGGQSRNTPKSVKQVGGGPPTFEPVSLRASEKNSQESESEEDTFGTVEKRREEQKINYQAQPSLKKKNTAAMFDNEDGVLSEESRQDLIEKLDKASKLAKAAK